MVKVELYKYLSDAKDIVECSPETSIKSNFPELDFRNYIILVNGERIDSEEYILKEGDFVQLRSCPEVIWEWIVAAIAISIPVAILAITFGKDAYEKKKAAAAVSSGTTEENQNVKDDVKNIPYLGGASNSIATGKTQPYIIGRHKFTPYILNGGGGNYKGYHTITGDHGVTQFYNVVLEGGFCKQNIEAIYAGDILIASPKLLSGEAEEGVYPLSCSQSWANVNSFIEIAQDGNDFDTSDFNQKIVEKEHSDVLYEGDEDNYEPLVYSLEDNAMGTDIEIMFNGLIAYDDSGNKVEKTRKIIPYYSYNYNQLVAEGNSDAMANATWIEFPSKFQTIVHTDALAIDETGHYSYTFYGSRWGFDDEPTPFEYTEQTALWKAVNDINSWTFLSGNDIRSRTGCSFEVESFTYRHLARQNKYDLKIKLRFWSYTPESNVVTPSTTFTGKYSKQLRYMAHADFSFTDLFTYSTDTSDDGAVYTSWQKKYDYPIAVKLVSDDKKNTSGSEVCTCYCEWVHSYCYDEDATKAQSSSATSFVKERIIGEREAKLSTLIGLHIEATSENEDSLGQISIITSGLARTWDSTTKAWSSTKSATSNPAAWYLEVLTSDCHPVSKLSDDEIDMDALGAWYESCEAVGYCINYVIASGETKSNILQMILDAGRGVAYRNIYGKISVAVDKINDAPIGILNEQNLISFSYTKDVSRSPDGIKVTYINEAADFQEDSFIVMYNQYDSNGNFDPYGKNRSTDCVLKEVQATGMTTWFQAYRYALYLMKCDRLRPKLVTASVGYEGIYYTPMAKLLIQHPSLKIGLGNAEIKAVVKNSSDEIVGLDLYDAVELDTDHTFNVIINCVSDTYSTPLSKELISDSGRVKSIYFAEAIASDATVVPHAGDILSYGYGADTVTSPMLISGIEPTDNGFTLTMVDYNEEIYSMGSDFTDYRPNLTQPQALPAELPSEVPNLGTDTLISIVDKKTADSIASLYNTVTITLYRESDTKLDSSDLPTGTLSYSFAEDTISWSGDANGWSRTYPEDATSTVYITTATAFGKSSVDTIGPTEWATPIASGNNGVNGYNTATINLYCRKNEAIGSKPDALVYSFKTGILSVAETGGSFNGWRTYIPSVDDASSDADGNVYEIHATALSTELTDTITSAEWSEPAQITAPSGITAAEVQTMIDKAVNNVLETPNVWLDTYSVCFAVDADKKTTVGQQVSLTAHVVQAREELDFTIEEAQLPSGFTYTKDGNTIILYVGTDVTLTTGSIVLPITYKAYKYNYVLGRMVDDTEYQYFGYTDSEGNEVSIGFKAEATSSTTVPLTVTYTTVTGGRYLGSVSSLDGISALTGLIIGDYLTYSGDTVASTMSQTGNFVKSMIYKYVGTGNTWKWENDSNVEHMSGALSDVLAIVDTDLQSNNSQVYEYLEHLTANSIFADRLAANTAFIDKLIANEAFIDKLTSSGVIADSIEATDLTLRTGGAVKSNNFNGTVTDGKITVDGTAGWAIDYTGKAVFSNVDITGGTIKVGSNFSVDSSGNLSASNASLSGAITGGSININNTFTVDSEGKVTASNLNITGGTVSIGSNFSIESSGTANMKNASVSGRLTCSNGILFANAYVGTSLNDCGNSLGAVPYSTNYYTMMSGIIYMTETFYSNMRFAFTPWYCSKSISSGAYTISIWGESSLENVTSGTKTNSVVSHLQIIQKYNSSGVVYGGTFTEGEIEWPVYQDDTTPSTINSVYPSYYNLIF